MDAQALSRLVAGRPVPLLIGIGVFMAALIGYNALYIPQQEQVRLSQAKIVEEQATQQVQAEVTGLLSRAERYRARLPQEPDPSALVRDVVELAQRSGLQMTSITREPPEASAEFTRLSVTLQCTASYHQLGAFLDALERSDRFLQVDHLQMDRRAPTEPIAIRLTMSTLHVPPLVAPGTS